MRESEDDGRRAVDRDREQNRQPRSSEARAAREQKSGDDRPERRRRGQEAVAVLAHVQNPAREYRQQGRRRREEGRDEIERHRLNHDRRAPNELQPLAERREAYAPGLAALRPPAR